MANKYSKYKPLTNAIRIEIADRAIRKLTEGKPREQLQKFAKVGLTYIAKQAKQIELKKAISANPVLSDYFESANLFSTYNNIYIHAWSDAKFEAMALRALGFVVTRSGKYGAVKLSHFSLDDCPEELKLVKTKSSPHYIELNDHQELVAAAEELKAWVKEHVKLFKNTLTMIEGFKSIDAMLENADWLEPFIPEEAFKAIADGTALVDVELIKSVSARFAALQKVA